MFRHFSKNKVTNCINIFGLAIGMSASMLILLWVQNEFSYDDFHPDVARIYRISFSGGGNASKWDGSPLLFANYAKQEVPGIEKTARFLPITGNNLVIEANGGYYKELSVAYVDSGWFNLFYYSFAEGSATAFNHDPNSVILTRSLARRYYGNQNAVGKIIKVDSSEYVVRGVVRDNPSNSSFQFAMFFPLTNLLTDAQRRINEKSWQNFGYETFF